MSDLAGRLQQTLQQLYDVDPRCAVADFLTSDRRQLPASVARTGTDEQLLVLAESDALSVSVFIDDGVLNRLALADPLRRLHGGNLADFWTLLEGVSHFVCLAWNALHDRDVSVLDLELQAEVDKFVVTAELWREQGMGRHPSELHRLLFERTRIDARLAGARHGLYRAATRHASQFCRRLERHMKRAASRPGRHALSTELRRFYRLGDLAKLSYIASH